MQATKGRPDVGQETLEGRIAAQKAYVAKQAVMLDGEPVILCWEFEKGIRTGKAYVLPADVVLEFVSLGINPRFYRTATGKVGKTVSMKARIVRFVLARWVLNLDSRETFSFRGDPRDFRRSNLVKRPNLQPVKKHNRREWIITHYRPTSYLIEGLEDSIVPARNFRPESPYRPIPLKG